MTEKQNRQTKPEEQRPPNVGIVICKLLEDMMTRLLDFHRQKKPGEVSEIYIRMNEEIKEKDPQRLPGATRYQRFVKLRRVSNTMG